METKKRADGKRMVSGFRLVCLRGREPDYILESDKPVDGRGLFNADFTLLYSVERNPDFQPGEPTSKPNRPLIFVKDETIVEKPDEKRADNIESLVRRVEILEQERGEKT